MKRVESISEESKELVSLMNAQPVVKRKIEYYENNMKANSELFDCIQERIAAGYTKSTALVFGFIPVVTKNKLDSTDIARLNVELQQIEDVVYNNKQYYESWLARSKSYELKMDDITRECNQNFDAIFDKAMEVENNPRLAMAMKNYKNEEGDQQLKNEYYLVLRQEVNNFEVHGKNSRV